MNEKEKVKFPIIAIVVLFGFLVYSLHPELGDFRNSIYGLLVVVIAVFSLITYICLSRKINMPLIGKSTIIAFGVLYLFFGIIDIGRIEALFFLVYSFVNIAISIYVYKKTGIGYKSIWGFGAFSYLSTIIVCLRVHYINGQMPPFLLYSSIIVAVIVFIPCLLYGLNQFKINKDKEKLICVPLLGLLGGFCLTYLTLGSMNVYLDISKPIYEEYLIIDKDIRTGAKQITTYELEVQKDDIVFTIAVSEEDYYDYKINDVIILSEYKGLFNEPYIIYDND